jgi:anthranilate synthase component 2/putative glutamine amidotransferase
VRPVIGISTYREQARWGSWDVPAVLLPANYVDAVATAGGEPILLPTGATSPDIVSHLDGLVLAGGADLVPESYGQEAGPRTTVVRPDRDASETRLLEVALDRGLPVLAICRGMQLLNVVLGGDLVQHLPDEPGVGEHDPGPGRFTRREVRLAADSQLATLLGDRAAADCHHHQALGKLGTGLVAVGWAEDGTVEAVERAGSEFCVGVQWHPEAGDDRRLFAALVSVTRGRDAGITPT